MTGIIDVGGGQRGIYGAGVLDRFIDEKTEFGCCIGVSAGSANMAAFLGGQHGRNYRFYHEYAVRREYMSMSNYLKSGSYIDLDYIYGKLSNEGGEDPLDYDVFLSYGGVFNIVATDAADGSAVYFGAEDMKRNDYRILNASSCLPVICRPVMIGAHEYYDGGISDPVPLDRLFSLGADKAVVILTQPRSFIMDGRFENVAAHLLERRAPKLAQALRLRPEKYNSSVEKAKQLEKDGKCIIIAPDSTEGMGTVTKKPELLDALYKKGYEDAGTAMERLA